MAYHIYVASGSVGEGVYGLVTLGQVFGAPTSVGLLLDGGGPFDTGIAPYTVVASGGLPTGLTIGDDGFGSQVLLGTASALGSFSFDLTVTDSIGNTSTQPFVWRVVPNDGIGLDIGLPVPIATGGVFVGVPTSYQLDIVAVGGAGVPPYTVTEVPGIVSGISYLDPASGIGTAQNGQASVYYLAGSFAPTMTLPPGLSMDPGGLVTGIPLGPDSPTYLPYLVTWSVVDSVGHWGLACQYGMFVHVPPPSISCSSPPDGTVGVPYSHQMPISGGTPPYTVSIVGGALPPGLNIDNSGLITGTPISAGAFPFAVLVVDSLGDNGFVVCSITINGGGPVLPLAPACNNPPVALLLQLYAHNFVASGGTPPYSWAVIAGSLPPGVTLNGATGIASGDPTASGVFGFTLQVTDSGASTATSNCQIIVAVDLKNLEIIVRGVKRVPAASCEPLEEGLEPPHVKRAL